MTPVNPDHLGGWRLTRAGLLLLFLTALTGPLIPLLEVPKLGVVAHMHGLLNGILLLALGSPWPRLRMHMGTSVLASWGLVVACFAVVLVVATCAAARVGGETFPVFFAGYVGSSLVELVVKVLVTTLSVVILAALGAATLAGFRSSGL